MNFANKCCSARECPVDGGTKRLQTQSGRMKSREQEMDFAHSRAWTNTIRCSLRHPLADWCVRSVMLFAILVTSAQSFTDIAHSRFTLREEHRLKVFENDILWLIFGSNWDENVK